MANVMENARGLMSTIERSFTRMNTDANGIQLFWGPRCKIRKLWEVSQKVVSVLQRPDRHSFTELNQHEHEEDTAHPDSIGLLEGGGPDHDDHDETDMPSTSSYDPRVASSNRKYSYGSILLNDQQQQQQQQQPGVGVHHGGIASQLHLSDKHLLSTIQIVGLTFFMVAGGPFGFQGAIAAGGPMLVLLGLIFVPLVWSIPMAFMTAEMACMIPESGGHVLWVYRAFGPFWSFLNSFFAVTSSMLNNAMYPYFFALYVSTFVSTKPLPHALTVVLKALMLLAVTIMNVLGIDIVGNASIVLAASVLVPFMLMCIMGLSHINFNWMGVPISNDIDRGKFLAIFLWNTSGFDLAGTCASEVKNPSRSYPRALKFTLILIISAYAFPALVGISLFPDHTSWKFDTYNSIAKIVGGGFLESWMGLSATLSTFGLLLTHLCTCSRLVYGMAQVEQLPPAFTMLHHVYGTPWVAILATSFCTLVFSFFDFSNLMESNMMFYALSTFLKFGALVQLRYTEPDVFRPITIPFEKELLALWILIPIAMCVAMVYYASERSHGIVLVGWALAILGYIGKEAIARYGMDEAVQQRMHRVEQNMERMKQRIDRVIEKEFSVPCPLEPLRHTL